MNEQHSLFITGNSSGLGYGFSEAYLERGWTVYGCSRRGCDLAGELEDVRCDLNDFDAIPLALDTLLGELPSLDLVILNAGVLGEIKLMHETSLEELRRIMEINVWANKVILDWLLDWGRPVRQIVAISSGAAVLGNKGWGGYALSKATLNMLMRLYAHEFPDSHLSAIAPGLIDTAMMDYLCEEPDPEEYPALARLRGARGSDVMPGPREAAERVISVMERFRAYPNGSFIDIREILAPEEYAQMMASQNLNRPKG